MIIKVLLENTSRSDRLASAHGLSLYIQTDAHKILFDAGPGDHFLENAQKMDVNISDVDIFVLSHGHYDHGGGLQAFLRSNTKAKLYIHRLAFEPHFAMREGNRWEDIGLDPNLKDNKRIVWTSGRYGIDKGIQVFSDVMRTHETPGSNRNLFIGHAGQKEIDVFDHEQNLIIEDNGISVLLTGCAHNGIKNIIEHYFYTMGKMPDYVIGGFHLSSRQKSSDEDIRSVQRLGRYFMSTQAQYYTGHCTGQEAYEPIKNIMNDHIRYAATGCEIDI